MTTLFQRQLNYVFNRPDTEPAWYWDDNTYEEGVFEDTPLSAFVFIETLLLDAKAHLSPYSDAQIGLGLNYIFNSACSNLAYEFKIAAVPFEHKNKAVEALSNVFQDVFNERCDKVLSAGSQAPLSKINLICYMFWDVCCWDNWSNVPENQAQNDVEMYKTIAFVMHRCLGLSNIACVESGLHGLGHLVYKQPEIAVPMIDDFINNGKTRHNNALLDYAKMARTGMIQ